MPERDALICALLQETYGEAARCFEGIRKGDRLSLMKLAVSLADREYQHPDCEAAHSRRECRSFCLHHERVTPQSVLLIHGWTACPFEMRELGEYLFRQGYNVYGLRLAGHGTNVADFSKASSTDWKLSARKGLAIAVLLGETTVAVGESMGGSLAAILGKDYADLINRLVLCAPCFRIKDFRAEFTTLGVMRKFMPTVYFEAPPAWAAPYWYYAIPSGAVAELVRVAREARKTVFQLRMPVLIIQAVNDQMVRAKTNRSFFQRMVRRNKNHGKLVWFAGGHHNLTVNLNPKKADVFEWIGSFIASITM